MGFHLETGLFDRVGLHVRNDRVANNAHTEIAVQYAAIRSDDGMSGFSPFVELELPTHRDERDRYALVGFSTARCCCSSTASGDIDGAFAGASRIVEAVGRRARGDQPNVDRPAGMSLRVDGNLMLGIAIEKPVSGRSEFTSRLMLTLEVQILDPPVQPRREIDSRVVGALPQPLDDASRRALPRRPGATRAAVGFHPMATGACADGG